MNRIIPTSLSVPIRPANTMYLIKIKRSDDNAKIKRSDNR